MKLTLPTTNQIAHLKDFFKKSIVGYYKSDGFMDSLAKVTQSGIPYPQWLANLQENTEFRKEGGLPMLKRFSEMLYQYHASVLFNHWKIESSVLYDIEPTLLESLQTNGLEYRKKLDGVELFPYRFDLKEHPVAFKPFSPHALRHSDEVVSILMWLDTSKTLAAPLSSTKRFRQISSQRVKTNIALKNLHRGHALTFNEGIFVYCEYHLCLCDRDGNIITDGSRPQDSVYAWTSKIMLFKEDTVFEEKFLTETQTNHRFLFTHLNLLTCLQNPKTVVKETSNYSRQQVKQAKKRKRNLTRTKTLFVEPETLQQINSLRETSQSTTRTQSYQYERQPCEAKKWVLKSNLEVGMEVIAKKPRRSGEGYLYLVNGKRKGAVCNAHLPPKEKIIQTVKVKQFRI